MKFILSDESVKNSHGFYLMNSGGDFSRFAKNPVMLLEHDPGNVIGKWQNLAVSGHQLTAEALFDIDNDKGKEAAGQVERGFLSGASLGIIVKRAEYRYNEVLRVDDIVVTEWELLEASVVSVPANPAALCVRVYSDETTQVEEAQLSAYLDNIVKLSIKENMITKEAMTALGLPTTASPTEVSAAVVALATRAKELNAEVETLREERTKQSKERAEALVTAALSAGKIDATGKDALLKFATDDYAAAEAMLSGMPTRKTYGDKVVPVSMTAKSERDDWNYHDWKRNAPAELEQLKAERPDEYNEILKKSRKK